MSGTTNQMNSSEGSLLANRSVGASRGNHSRDVIHRPLRAMRDAELRKEIERV